ncbi:MAG TPA: hypothetical protein VF170_02975, partial [Planctomycetaceae bacterium]
LREGEILDAGMKLRGRQFELSRKRTLQWPDLEEPRPLIERAAGEYGLRVEGLERIPYDLWGAGQLVNVNAAEALTALLIQFDLTFAWTGDADGVRLVAIPDEVAVKRLHRPRRGGVEAAVRTVARAFPRRTVTRQGAGLELAATVEEHEEVERLLGNRRAPQGDRPAADLGPLRQRRFTLSVVRQPASRIIETLETQDVTVDYDPDALEEAGIDLEQKVSLDLSQASADEFFRALCEPLGLDFAIDDRTATLTPRK